jgi:hypothetical protein
MSRLRSGCVVRYPYLWAREAERGETEGRKERPTAVALLLRRGESVAVMLLPISTSPPVEGRWAIEIPQREKQRAGLDPLRRQWLVLDEMNQDRLEDSYYLHPTAIIGAFSRGFIGPVIGQVIKQWASVRRVPRH